MLASYASDPAYSKGRLYKQENCKFRNVFQRDRDRIIHSAAFRRLEYKTQVFVNHEGDHYRTRLTHSLEVAQVARSIARILLLCEDLTECLALAHDLGHPPFGHAGEDALNQAMKEFGGFDHNAHTIKILTSLEHRYASFDGLNLTWETLEGIAKHNGPLTGKYSTKKSNPNNAIFEYSKKHDLKLDSFPSLEAQVASLADDIAYNNHDLEDGLRANLFTVSDLKEISYLGDIIRYVEKKHPNLEKRRLIHEFIRKMVNNMVMDLLETTKKNIEKYNIQTIDDVRNAKKAMVEFSETITSYNKELKEFLRSNMYRHYKVNRMTSKSKMIVIELFEAFYNEPGCLPTKWQKKAQKGDDYERAQVVGDFIAGMTDRFALKEHSSIFDISTNL